MRWILDDVLPARLRLPPSPPTAPENVARERKRDRTAEEHRIVLAARGAKCLRKGIPIRFPRVGNASHGWISASGQHVLVSLAYNPRLRRPRARPAPPRRLPRSISITTLSAARIA